MNTMHGAIASEHALKYAHVCIHTGTRTQSCELDRIIVYTFV